MIVIKSLNNILLFSTIFLSIKNIFKIYSKLFKSRTTLESIIFFSCCNNFFLNLSIQKKISIYSSYWYI